MGGVSACARVVIASWASQVLYTEQPASSAAVLLQPFRVPSECYRVVRRRDVYRGGGTGTAPGAECTGDGSRPGDDRQSRVGGPRRQCRPMRLGAAANGDGHWER